MSATPKGRQSRGRLQAPDNEHIAWMRRPGRGPTVVWLGGFGSDMTGAKAGALDDWAAGAGHALVRFDYFGHGASSGKLVDGSIGRWREDCLRVVDELSEGPVILVGSSMGGWLACLAALARPERVCGLVLVAPAADFTQRLMEPALGSEGLSRLYEAGVLVMPSAYDAAGYAIGRKLIEDGRNWSILDGPVEIHTPVRILHGGEDADVPWRHGVALAEAIVSRNVVFSLIKDGDHRLSRPQDIRRLTEAVRELADQAASAASTAARPSR